MRQESDREKSCDIILVSPYARGFSSYLPIGLLCLSSFLKERGIAAMLMHPLVELRSTALYYAQRLMHRQGDLLFRAAVLKEISLRKPVIAGISCYTNEYHWAMDMARRIKEETGTCVVVGGYHAMLKPRDFIFKGSPVDYVIIGEGETPLAELAAALKNKQFPRQCRHLGYLGADDNPVIGTCNIEKDISVYPEPDYSKVDMRYFTRPALRHIRLIALSGVEIFTSRGCPYDCEYCSNKLLWQASCQGANPVRYRDINLVIKELKGLSRQYQIDGFYILDDCFLLSKERAGEFCEKLIREKLGLVWGMETRADLLNSEPLLRLMKRAGLVQIDFGVESGSPEMLKGINKGITLDQTRRAFELCGKNGIRTFANILLNLPGETRKDILLTEQLLDEIKPTVVSTMLTAPYLGTKIYEKYLTPKLGAREYDIFNQNINSEIVDPRFRLARHDLDLAQVLLRFQAKYRSIGQYICLSPRYWRKILRSRHFFGYLLVYILAPLDILIGYCMWFDAARLNNTVRKTVRKIMLYTAS